MVNLITEPVQQWNPVSNYNINDVVIYDNNYYFCFQGNTNINPTSANSNLVWLTQNIFGWAPSYSNNLDIESLVSEVPLGDGYTQRTAKGLGNTRFRSFSYKFDLISQRQARAMSIFLSNPLNLQFFYLFLPAPHNIQINVIVDSWDLVINYVDNYTLTINFEQYNDYEFQPTWMGNGLGNTLINLDSNSQLVNQEIVGFLATSPYDNKVHYATCRANVYASLYGKLYQYKNLSQFEVVLPYLFNGKFVNANGLSFNVVAAAVIDNQPLVGQDTYAGALGRIQSQMATSQETNLSGQVVPVMQPGEFVVGYLLDGKLVYIRVISDKIADIHTGDLNEQAAINGLATLQFFPFPCQYNATCADLVPGLNSDNDTNCASAGAWATMNFSNLFNFWWFCGWFAAISPYGGATVNVQATLNGLEFFTPQTFFATGPTFGGDVYGYCWVDNGYHGARYISDKAEMDFNNFWTTLIPPTILSTQAAIIASITIPLCTQYGYGLLSCGSSFLGPDFNPIEGTESQGTGGGGFIYNFVGNPNRGISQGSNFQSQGAVCVQGPNYYSTTWANPIQYFCQPWNVPGNPYPRNDAIAFDGARTFCLCAIPYNGTTQNFDSYLNDSNNKYAAANAAGLVASKNPYALIYNGIPPFASNGCNLSLSISGQAVPDGLCLNAYNLSGGN